ncbi:MAG: cupin domain-containing protein [Candidatus Omnitrophica bacterium]|nr:cupin domain-containing protein [Candidatus Omnitrophota bacterium]MDD5611322.1 cupin domain-containing protein [Candidatus Omnitrophota bacterium]
MRKREAFKTLARGKGFRLERIVSKGQATVKGKWLKERSAEWAIVLQGKASLLFKGKKEKCILKAGDYIFIPANTLHRVEWTHPKQKTVWLALHLR